MLAEFILPGRAVSRSSPCRDLLDLDAAWAVRLWHRKSQRGYDFIHHLRWYRVPGMYSPVAFFGNGLLDLLQTSSSKTARP